MRCRTVKWKRCTEHGKGERRARTELPRPLQIHCFPSTLICSPALKLSKPYHLGYFMEASSCRHDWLNHWPLVIELYLQPFPLGVGYGGVYENSNPLIMAWSFWPPAPVLKLLRNSQPSVISKRRFYHSRDSTGFRSCMPGQTQRLNIYFLLYHSQPGTRLRSITSIDAIMKKGKGRTHGDLGSCDEWMETR